MVSCGFSENKGLGGVSAQSGGLIKPGVGGSSYTDNYCRSQKSVMPAKYTFFLLIFKLLSPQRGFLVHLASLA